MFLSAIIPLNLLNAPPPGQTPFLGREAHALFFDLVRRHNPALAESLHEPRGDTLRAFTISAPRPAGKTNAQFDWRITAFDDTLAQTLMEAILPNLPREVRLGSLHFAPGAPITDAAQHRWAGTTTAEALVEKSFGAEKKIERRMTFEFASPTAHRQIHRNVLFPIPAQMWGGWLRAWNSCAQPAFEEDLIARVEAQVAISQYELKTALINFGEFRAAGWLGHATFYDFGAEASLTRVLNLLADFAFYCGTGYKTTQGMGQTRRV